MNSIDDAEKIKAYIDNVYYVLEVLREKGLDKKYPKLVEAAELYAKDAEYYLSERKDLFTALACIAYAEGLIDSLRYLGLEEINWKPLSSLLKRPKVLVAGSFEIIHPGHLFYLREAWKKGRVYVIVARDKGINRFKNRDSIVPEKQRVEVVKDIRYVYKAVLGDEEDYLKPVEEIKPDIILLGPDQWPNEEKLYEELKKRGLGNVKIERLRERINEGIYSTTSIIRNILKKYCSC